MSLGTCPHCQAGIRPMPLLRTSRRRPYLCPPCGGASVIVPASGAIAIVVYTAVAAIPLLAIVLLEWPLWTLFVAAIAAALAIPLALARLCRFAAVDT